MPRPRFLRADPQLQSRILDAAARELAHHGYEGASLNQILLAAGLSKGAFYYYFDDKADLAVAVLEREIRRWDLHDLRSPSSAAEFWAELERYTRQGLAELREAPQRSDLLTRLGLAIARDPELMKRCGPLMSQAQHEIAAFWRHGQEVGAIRIDLSAPALIAVVQAAKTALATALLPSDRGATPDELEMFTRVYLDLVRRIVEPHGEPHGKEAKP